MIILKNLFFRTDQMRNDYKVMQSLDEHTKVNPTKRYQDLIRFSAAVTSSPEVKTGFSEWGLKLNPQPLKVEGRKLAPEMILVGEDRPISAGPKGKKTEKNPKTQILIHFF